MPIGSPKSSGSRPSRRQVGILSTYPPKLCGLATFTAALEGGLAAAGDEVTIVAIDDGRDDHTPLHSGAHRLVNGLSESVQETARVLSRGDVAIVQHEYGIYGGADGDEVLDVLQALEVPAIVVLHTVPETPTERQRLVLEQVAELAARLIVMSDAAGDRLTSGYAVDSSKVVMIPHGATGPARPVHTHIDVDRPRLLTWGLLGPGKGIEYVIRALSLLEDVTPRIRYTVAGATHPKVFARDGDRYRQSLIREAWATGVVASVNFDDAYRNVADLMRFVSSASLVVLPYDSRDQATSGVLVDAIAAGRPVIATVFPHAVELLSDGAGIIVPHADPVAIAAAVREAVCEPGRLDAMAARARAIAPSLGWTTVAAQYQQLCDELSPAAIAVAG